MTDIDRPDDMEWLSMCHVDWLATLAAEALGETSILGLLVGGEPDGDINQLVSCFTHVGELYMLIALWADQHPNIERETLDEAIEGAAAYDSLESFMDRHGESG